MVERHDKAAAAPEVEYPCMTAAQFEASPEFRAFKRAMGNILKVSKAELDERVKRAKESSPRSGNPNAPGRKKRR